MAKKPERPKLKHCKVRPQTHPTAPWRVWFTEEIDGRPVRRARNFASEDDAWAWATTKDIEVAKHGARFGNVTPEARRAIDAFRDLCDDLVAAGIKPPRFEDVVSEAVARIRASRASIPVTVAVGRFLDAKEREEKSPRHLSDLRSRLGFFSQDFGGRAVGSVSTAEVDAWLSGLTVRRVTKAGAKRGAKPRPLSARSIAHCRAKVHALFAFAKRQGWTTDNPVAGAIAPKPPRKRPAIYSPPQARKILDAALRAEDPRLVPVLALGFFAGLRTSEILRLRWEGIDLNADHLRIDVGKCGSRLATMTLAARAWLATSPRRTGPVWPVSERRLHDGLRELVAGLEGVPMIPNGMRHAYISHRCAETRNPAAVADECGTSPAVIQRHYRETVVPADAAEYFSILPPPEAGAKLIQFGA